MRGQAELFRVMRTPSHLIQGVDISNSQLFSFRFNDFGAMDGRVPWSGHWHSFNFWPWMLLHDAIPNALASTSKEDALTTASMILWRALTSLKVGFNLVVLSFKVSWKAKYFVQGLKFQVVLVCVAISCTILPFLTSPLNSFMIILASEVSHSSFFTFIFSDISVNVNRITSSTSAL